MIDLRNRAAFAPGHVPGTINIGLDDSFVTYVGWLIPWGTPVTLLGSSELAVEEAQRELVRIGIDRPAAAAVGLPGDWTAGELAGYRTATFADLQAAQVGGRPPHVLDVRRDLERAEAHIRGSQHIPLHDLTDRLDDVPVGEPVWVHCAAGYRASIAASLLARGGRRPVLIDDEFDRAASTGLDVVTDGSLAVA